MLFDVVLLGESVQSLGVLWVCPCALSCVFIIRGLIALGACCAATLDGSTALDCVEGCLEIVSARLGGLLPFLILPILVVGSAHS